LLLGGTIACVALADFLFFGHVVGWTAGLFAAVLLGLLVIRGGRFFGHWPGRVLFVAAAGLVVALVEEPGVLPVLMAALCVAMLSVLNRADWCPGVVAWSKRLLHLFTRGTLRLFTDNRIAARRLRRHPTSVARPARAAVAWVLPVGLGAGFVGLFTLANPLISKWVGELVNGIGNLWSFMAGFRSLSRNAFWVATAMVVYGLLRARRYHESRGRCGVDDGPSESAPAFDPEPWELARAAKRAGFETGVVLRCLAVFNALFLVQNALDVVYLFGGMSLPDGMGYAAYAHRGAYPLVATALLAAAFVLVAFRPGAAAERSVAARRLVYLWVAQNVFLTITAAWRLDLYVDAYSLTRLRLAAGIWMALVAAGLAWIACRIVLRRGNTWLLHANLLTAAVVLYACCFLNVNGFIADFNVRHCRESGGGGQPIDVAYLQSLGPEALPALRLAASRTADTRSAATADDALSELDGRLTRTLSDWRGWTLRRGRLCAGGPAPSRLPGSFATARRAAHAR
jgi:hypothetical protein